MHDDHELDDPYCSRRADNEARWSFVREYLGDDHRTLLDVGCAEGYFTAAAAEHGLQATGIEAKPERYRYAEATYGDRDGAQFRLHRVTPETVADLPAADVTLLLTVQHHWARFFGVESATRMLRTVARKTELLCYEPPGTVFLTAGDPIDPDESVERYRAYLAEQFGDSASIRGIRSFEHVDEDEYADRRDPLFVIDTENV